MTTLPATIPGLVRRCSPVIDHAGDKMVACELVPGIGARCLDGGKLHGYTFRSLNLDIADPTGFYHALVWLAEKLGMDASTGAIWRKTYRGRCMNWKPAAAFGASVAQSLSKPNE